MTPQLGMFERNSRLLIPILDFLKQASFAEDVERIHFTQSLIDCSNSFS